MVTSKMPDYDKPSIIVLSEKSVSYNITNTFWIPCSAKFVSLGSTPSAEGIIQIHEIRKGQIELLREVTFPKSLKCGTFGASSLQNRHLATGDFVGNLNIWDIEHSFSPIYSVQAHTEIIHDIDGIGGSSVGHGAPEIVTGSHDGYVKVWDPRQKEKPVVIMEAMDQVKRQCWAVAFGNSYNAQERVVCSGYDNGDIKMFDLRNMSLRWESTLPNGVCSLEFDRNDIKMNKLLATALEGTIAVFKSKNNGLDFMYTHFKGHSNTTVWQGKHLPQNREILASCGGYGSLCLWKYEYCEWLSNNANDFVDMLSIHSSPISNQCITSFDWSPDKIGLSVCSSIDQVIRLVYFTNLNLQ